ncbi:hypothetical protein EGR_06777 [Echinococcus granulosus]|uniref:Uncharacterized protein n=1 Tax=Echinococcus granulosus TaxID=6210 RepID=W6UB97_ECHGR|nr:hypothetical protein EGR_06777 [Echinococcus granulosus]EUB58370.1 hypothetical protein EGR_06777 [Echinococcus granulosus]
MCNVATKRLRLLIELVLGGCTLLRCRSYFGDNSANLNDSGEMKQAALLRVFKCLFEFKPPFKKWNDIFYDNALMVKNKKQIGIDELSKTKYSIYLCVTSVLIRIGRKLTPPFILSILCSKCVHKSLKNCNLFRASLLCILEEQNVNLETLKTDVTWID